MWRFSLNKNLRERYSSPENAAYARRAFVVTVIVELLGFIALLASLRAMTSTAHALFWINGSVFAAALLLAIVLRLRDERLPGVAGFEGQTRADPDAISGAVGREFQRDVLAAQYDTRRFLACRVHRSGWSWGEWLVIVLAPNEDDSTTVFAMSWNASQTVNVGTARRILSTTQRILPIENANTLDRPATTRLVDEWIASGTLTNERPPQPSWIQS